ncbi:MAG: transposase [Bdellovibrionales bacterium]|nr:transposase [Bdellovibrionales bacterium]
MEQTLADLGENWIEREFCHTDFGDARLNSRFFRVAHLLASKASASIYETCGGNWSEAKGIYRFFGNEKVSAEEIISSHQVETIGRMRGHNLLFSIQDTSYLDFDSHEKTEGLGSISKAYKKTQNGTLAPSGIGGY